MSELPPLPESDDPFEVLGVERDIDADGLRRAYVRLIKLYRPDRAPAEFAQIRAAYEEARMRVTTWRDYSDWEDDDEDEAGDDAGDEGDDPVFRSIAAAWTALADGEDARALLLKLQEPAQDERVALHRYLLADAAGVGAQEEVASALRQGRPVAEWLVTVASPDTYGPWLLGEEFGWEMLCRQEGRHAAAVLMRMRLHRLILRGRLDLAVAEVLGERYVADAEHLHLLQWAGQEVCAVAGWAGLQDLERLKRRYASSIVEDFQFLSPEDHLAASEALREQWLSWRELFGSMRTLRRFLVLSPILDPHEVLPLVDELGVDFLSRPRTYVTCFGAMAETSPELAQRFILAAASLPWEKAPEDQVLDIAGLVKFNGLLRERRRVHGTCDDDEFYETIVRPLLTSLVIETDLSPVALVGLLEKHRPDVRRLAMYEQHIRDDRMLVSVYWCRRLASYGLPGAPDA